MKELSTEEKAEAYDEAYKEVAIRFGSNVADKIFLKESEDEKILRSLKAVVKEYDMWTERGLSMNDVLSWLEKQGEQKPVDKVEPKFHEGDMIIHKELGGDYIHNPHKIIQVDILDKKYRLEGGLVAHFGEQDDYELVEQKPADKVEPKFHEGEWVVFNGFTLYIKEVVKGFYRTITRDGIPNGYDWDIDKTARLWTIQDAKDGDVLSYREGQWCFIYKGIVTENTFKYYALLSEKGITVNDAAFSLLTSCITPATKEQRDLLFSKMKEAGYEWDADKKELKKIEQKPSDIIPQDFEKYVEHLLSLSDGEGHGSPAKVKEVSAELFRLAKLQKPAEWSEEDENMLNNTIILLKHYTIGIRDFEKNASIDWLKSLKDRVQPQNRWKPSDLPHWKKSTLPNDNTTGFNSDCFCYKGYNINYKELFEKLPKDD